MFDAPVLTLSPRAAAALADPNPLYPLGDSLKRLADAPDTPPHVADWLRRMAAAETQHPTQTRN